MLVEYYFTVIFHVSIGFKHIEHYINIVILKYNTLTIEKNIVGDS